MLRRGPRPHPQLEPQPQLDASWLEETLWEAGSVSSASVLSSEAGLEVPRPKHSQSQSRYRPKPPKRSVFLEGGGETSEEEEGSSVHASVNASDLFAGFGTESEAGSGAKHSSVRLIS